MGLEKRVVNVKVGDIYKLSIGLNKYSSYQDRVIGEMVYKNIHAISDYVDKVETLMKPVKEYYEGLENINSKHGVTKDNGYKCEGDVDAYRAEITQYIKEKNFQPKEQEIRKQQIELLDTKVDVELCVGMIEDMPKEFSAQDFEHFRTIIIDL